MPIVKIQVGVLLAVVLLLIEVLPASPRAWKPSPETLARDYVTINDTRPTGELVLLMWFVPPLIRADQPNAQAIKALLEKYVVIMASHVRIDKVTATTSVLDVGALEAKDQAGKSLTLLNTGDMPPTTVGLVTALAAVFRQSLGTIGNGMKFVVFDAGDVSSCKTGKLTVPLADETYTWETPIPGCPQQ